MSASGKPARHPSVDGLLTPMRQACPRDGPSGATRVQRLDGSRDSAIHTTYRISLRSSSMREPRYPLPGVISFYSKPRQTTQCLSESLSASAIRVPWRHSAPCSDTTTSMPRKTQKVDAGGAEEVAPPRQVVLHVRRSCSRKATTMILPQVHLRKPCYDFSFL